MKPDYTTEINNIVATLKKRYKPEKIILFGSFASGKPDENSDIDLLVIKKTKKNKIDRTKEVLLKLQYRIPLDLVIYTPQELRRALVNDNFFVDDIIKTGKVLYEKSDA